VGYDKHPDGAKVAPRLRVLNNGTGRLVTALSLHISLRFPPLLSVLHFYVVRLLLVD
jgi:hypothetical protein